MISAWWLVLGAPVLVAAGWWWRRWRGPQRDDKGKFTGGEGLWT